MQKILNLGLCVACLGLLAGCGSIQSAQNQRIQDQMEVNLKNCISSSANGERSRCFLIAYNDASRISNREPAKPALLKYITNAYELAIKYERGQFKNEQDFTIATKRLYNQYLAEVQSAQANSAAANAAASMRQQQLFMNAYRLLTPNGTGGMNCYPIQGGPSFGPTAGGMYCQ